MSANRTEQTFQIWVQEAAVKKMINKNPTIVEVECDSRMYLPVAAPYSLQLPSSYVT